MNFEQRREAALALLEQSGIWRSNYRPPIVQLLWRIGVDAPPPHFASFLANFALNGTYFGGIWGCAMWFALWSGQGMPLSRATLLACVAGLAFGLATAAYYRHSARKHGLPSWNDIVAPSTAATAIHN